MNAMIMENNSETQGCSWIRCSVSTLSRAALVPLAVCLTYGSLVLLFSFNLFPCNNLLDYHVSLPVHFRLTKAPGKQDKLINSLFVSLVYYG
jgi:hypothetical protein